MTGRKDDAPGLRTGGVEDAETVTQTITRRCDSTCWCLAWLIGRWAECRSESRHHEYMRQLCGAIRAPDMRSRKWAA